MFRTIFSGKKDKKKKLPVKERVKRSFLMLIGWNLVSTVAGKIFNAWLRLAERDRDIIKEDLFEEACKRHEVTPERLKEIMKDFKASKRCYWVLAWLTFYFWLMGMGLLYFQGVTLARINMAVASLGLMAIFSALSFKYAFRYWQCEIRRLANMAEFWAAGGGKRILRW